MNKRLKGLLLLSLLTGIVSFSLYSYTKLSNNSKIADITLSNIEAITNPETGPTPTCIYVGTLCIGVNPDGEIGYHPGLSHIEDF